MDEKYLCRRLWRTLASFRYVKLAISSSFSNLGGFICWISSFLTVTSWKHTHLLDVPRVDTKLMFWSYGIQFCVKFRSQEQLNLESSVELSRIDLVRKEYGNSNWRSRQFYFHVETINSLFSSDHIQLFIAWFVGHNASRKTSCISTLSAYIRALKYVEPRKASQIN